MEQELIKELKVAINIVKLEIKEKQQILDNLIEEYQQMSEIELYDNSDEETE